jgi:hypothetical protein
MRSRCWPPPRNDSSIHETHARFFDLEEPHDYRIPDGWLLREWRVLRERPNRVQAPTAALVFGSLSG